MNSTTQSQLGQFAARNELSATWMASIRDAVHQICTDRFPFPWIGLEERVKNSSKPFSLIAYGSLMNPDSAAKTIKGLPKNGYEAVVAFGGRRVYEYEIPERLQEQYRQQDPEGCSDHLRRAALNVRPTNDAEYLFNGRLIPISIPDLPGLRVREEGYDLEPFVVVPWGAPTERPFIAYALCCPAGSGGSMKVNPGLLPCPPYHRLCYDGARLVSEEFAQLFLDSTETADGRRVAADGSLGFTHE